MRVITMHARARHTVSAFDQELGELRAMILELAERTTYALDQAMRALGDRDRELAMRIVAADRIIDRLQARAEAAAVSLIALRAPMADDLREIIASIKIAALLERTADYARNIARRVPRMEGDRGEAPAQVIEMHEAVAGMLADVIEAFSIRDARAAHAICVRDEAVDALHDDLTQALVQIMIDHPERITEATHLMFIGKHLERIGDQATNIAEMVVYAATGEQPSARDTGPVRLAA